jgi:hypothetical protein
MSKAPIPPETNSHTRVWNSIIHDQSAYESVIDTNKAPCNKHRDRDAFAKREKRERRATQANDGLWGEGGAGWSKRRAVRAGDGTPYNH